MEGFVQAIVDELQARSTEEKRRMLPRFFKTGPGEYGEGDRFLGVVVPEVRRVAARHRDATPDEVEALLHSEWHEARLCALLILVMRCQKGDDAVRSEALDLYVRNIPRINNWDLVDLSAPTVVGEYLIDKPREMLYRMAAGTHAMPALLWEQRIAIVATLTLIRHGETDDTYRLATLLLDHRHDLIHKACGWMLREAGKRDPQRLYDYVDRHRTRMPRTMLRYAIEKFPPQVRRELMRR